MVFWEHKTEFVCFLSITEDTEVLVNSIDDDFWDAEDKIIGFLIDVVESLYWICL